MSTFKSFAVAGAGGIGKPIAAALLAQGASVVVLSRSATVAELDGIQYAKVDYADIAGVSKVLAEHKCDVLISTLNPEGLDYQHQLADAAKQAGVSLLLPSEFGMPTHGYKDGLFLKKNQAVSYARSLGLATLSIYVGFFIEALTTVNGFTVNGKVNIIGDSENVVGSVTAAADIAGFVAYVLTHLTPSELKNKIFRIEGDRVSSADIAKVLKTSVNRVEKIPGPDFLTPLQAHFGQGRCSTGWDEINKREGQGDEGAGSSNHLYPGHKWTTLVEGLKA
ncbi:hypothetical protein C8J56DRAFT_971783 [Mycena floridula]|nr:hypothetical protein C8J56DRAFT_971783 [Mycena floridula]